jgi:hypothetical protein
VVDHLCGPHPVHAVVIAQHAPAPAGRARYVVAAGLGRGRQGERAALRPAPRLVAAADARRLTLSLREPGSAVSPQSAGQRVQQC